MKKIILSALLLISIASHAQTRLKTSKLSIGAELDVLPYVTGGYYGSAWVSKNHFRYRAVITNVTTPEFMLSDGFTDNEVEVYAALVDYFFKPAPEKWWIGSGFEYWDAQIQSALSTSSFRYNNTMFTIGGGYIWKFYRNFYLNPWVAVHMRIAGDKDIFTDHGVFRPSSFVPEGSLKIGWYFNP